MRQLYHGVQDNEGTYKDVDTCTAGINQHLCCSARVKAQWAKHTTA